MDISVGHLRLDPGFNIEWTNTENIFASGGKLFLNTNNTTRLFMNNTGNVGIGTTSPKSKLDVEGGISVGTTYSGTTAAPSNGMIIEGNVGIGTTGPGAKLTVEQTGAADAFRVNDVAGDITPFVIDQNGNVGIGTTEPVDKFEVAGAIHISGEVAATKPNEMYLDMTSGPTTGHIDVIGPNTTTAGILQIRSLSTDSSVNNAILYASSSGNVGIGTTSPDEKFEVEFGDANKDVEIGVGTTDPDVTFITLRSPNGTKFYVTVNDAGALSASTTKP